MGLNDINSLSHTKWNCKYHIVFAPKYRRQVFYKEKRLAVGKILRQLCERKGVNIIEAEVGPDHVHMLLEIPPKIAVSSFMGYLKGKSSTMLYEQFGELKYKYRNREFWCKGYYVDTVGKNARRIAEYIKNQLKEDQLGEQITMSEIGPFRAASNSPCAAGRAFYTFDVSAKNKGLCPHVKNRPLGGRMFIPSPTCPAPGRSNVPFPRWAQVRLRSIPLRSGKERLPQMRFCASRSFCSASVRETACRQIHSHALRYSCGTGILYCSQRSQPVGLKTLQTGGGCCYASR